MKWGKLCGYILSAFYTLIPFRCAEFEFSAFRIRDRTRISHFERLERDLGEFGDLFAQDSNGRTVGPYVLLCFRFCPNLPLPKFSLSLSRSARPAASVASAAAAATPTRGARLPKPTGSSVRRPSRTGRGPPRPPRGGGRGAKRIGPARPC